jgi:hypothetical protein
MFGVIWLQEETPPKSYKSLSWHIPVSSTHLENVAYGRNLVNKSVKLSQDDM